MSTLGEILTRYGSDKDSTHAYGPVYDSLFPDRSAVRFVLELGIDNGKSLRAWREAFPNAHVVGLDLHGYPNSVDGRIECWKGDQKNPADLVRAVRGRLFDLIVDDASHLLQDQLFSLFMLWPSLAPGGAYVIEDLAGPAGKGDLTLKGNFGLFVGATVYETVGLFGPEPLVVIRKGVYG